MIGMQGWSAANLVKAIAAPPGAPSVSPEAGAFAFGAKLGFFGNNAPKWAILPKGPPNTNDVAYKAGWDAGDSDGITSASKLTDPRTIWTGSQGEDIPPSAYL